MSAGSHASRRPGLLRRARASVRLRAVLSLGVLTLPLGMGTLAFWTDSVVISGASFTGGTLDMSVSGGDPYASTTLAMPTMVPGATSAEVLTVQNVGNVAMKYSLTGGLSGTDAAAMAPHLTLTIRAGGTKSGATCTGGTSIYNAVLTTTTTTQLITTAAKRGPVPASPGTDALCFQVTFSLSAPTALQGKTATATLTFLGTSDLA
ncbi:SipW-dependent-type signal peptide-containing protein [Nocardioides sp. cx-173]|uniref:SipW-dependent-type signal peptide-containing protein n=1 Tax=Nocardioides sp. cx-173 TaxID=2898796 RepID=UPI001E57F903|nr:SipW-dependent-type signal peptide-containing protein [Nocardioides sp. cx-173]MCD4525155.1 CalY family protein [Nocardioides sp. cx-173]UGB40144.1 CalY family protein [Nocardioides sp. cx-173]